MSKPPDSTKELESNPWLLAYRQVLAYELREGETTIRKFMKDCGIETYNQAKEAMQAMVRAGRVVDIGKRTVRQDGLKPSSVNIYRLVDPNNAD